MIIELLKTTFLRRSKESTKETKFGTILGVFIPSLLMLFGVIIFLRLGWVVGVAGIPTTLALIAFAVLIAFITTLSMASISTNIEVGKGGVYYIISRSLGIEAGSSIGLPLYLKDSLCIAFSLIGFAESLTFVFPSFSIKVIGIFTLAILTILAFTSIKGALKVQLFIFITIILALISLFLAPKVDFGLPANPLTTIPSLTFWGLFAIFFPAMTGVESSVSLSGDLKNPSKSLPLGTIAAILVGSLIYLAMALFLSYKVPKEHLIQNTLIVQTIAYFPPLIVAGIWGATLSSALGGLLGAPRTLQAIADDGIVFRALGKTFGSGQDPKIATLVTCLIAFIGIYFGSIDQIAPLVTIVSLICYTVLNLSCCIETIMANPSFRPRFSVHWSISMFGAILSLIAMLMINAGFSILAISFIVLLYILTKRRNFESSWNDIREGILLFFSRSAIYKLAYAGPLSKSWRPHFLVFTNSSEKQSTSLLKFSESICQSKGFLTMTSFISKGKMSPLKRKEMADEMAKRLKSQNIEAFVQVKETDKISTGMKLMIEHYGLGPLIPDTLVFGGIRGEGEIKEFISVLNDAYLKHYNVVIMNDYNEFDEAKRKSMNGVDIWWDDEQSNNSELMVILAYMLQKNPLWKKTRVSIKALTTSESQKEEKLQKLHKICVEKRLPIDIEIVTYALNEDPFEKVKEVSKNAEMVFYSLKPPLKDEEAYERYLLSLSKASETFPSLIFVLSSEHTPLEVILQ